MGVIITINFHKNGQLVRTVTQIDSKLVNLAIGQTMCFDHQSIFECLGGKIVDIQHVVFLGDEMPLTYVDVDCDVAVN